MGTAPVVLGHGEGPWALLREHLRNRGASSDVPHAHDKRIGRGRALLGLGWGRRAFLWGLNMDLRLSYRVMSPSYTVLAAILLEAVGRKGGCAFHGRLWIGCD